MKARISSLVVLVIALGLTITVLVFAEEPESGAPIHYRDAHSAASVGADRASTEENPVQTGRAAAFTASWWTGGPVGASINAIAFDRVAGDTVYAGTAGGGLYRSTDAGDTWHDDPNDPDHGLDLGRGHGWVYDVTTSQGVVYAATHGYEWFHWSTDEGETWSHTSGSPGWARDLAVHPTLSSTLYAASGGGVYTSTNGGQDWSLASTGMAPDEWITEIAFNPVTPTTVYASSGNGRVYKSIDSGAQWVNSSAGLPGQNVWSVAVSPLTPTIVYAGLEAEGVWRSQDSGATWSPWSSVDIHCPYVREIVVDPADPQTIYVGTDCTGVYGRSEGDASWTHLGPFYATGQRRIYAMGMTADAPGTVLAGVWGDGIYKSTDGGQNWEARNVNLSAMNISRVEADPTRPGLIYATGRGGLFQSLDAGSTWERIRDTRGPAPLYSDAFALDIDDTTGIVYVGMYGGTLITSTDGVNWHGAHAGLASSCTVWDVAVHPVTPTTVYAGLRWGPEEQMGVYKSIDGGRHWVRASSGLTDTDVIAVAVDPSQPQVVYAGSPHGNVFRSADGGNSWTWSGSGVVIKDEWATIWDIVPDPEMPGVVYLAQSNEGVSGQGGIYKSTDFGMTWDRVFEGHDPRALVIDPVDHDVLMAASWNDFLYRSEDGGSTWSPYDPDAFPGYRYVQALAIGPTDSGWRLYAGTGTHSVWQRDIHEESIIYLPLVLRDFTSPGGPTTIVNGGFERDAGWEIPRTVYSADYTTAAARSGDRAMRVGIVEPRDNCFSYSSARQLVTIPVDAASATLRFWLYPISGAPVSVLTFPSRPLAPTVQDVTLSDDLQYVLILNEYGQWIDTILWQRRDDQRWTFHQIDLKAYAGRTIKLHFGVYNDGWDGVTAMYVDDVSLEIRTSP